MLQTAPPIGYTRTAKFFHWLIVLLVIAQFAIAWTMPDINRHTLPVGLVGWHLSIGATILVVVLARLLWRLTHPAPPPPADLSRVLQIVSRGTHFLLYALLIALPLMGWANVSARGWDVRLFGAIPLPPILATGSHLGRQMGGIHATTALLLLLVIALHLLGAAYHALVLKDRTLQRML